MWSRNVGAQVKIFNSAFRHDFVCRLRKAKNGSFSPPVWI